MDWTRTDTVRRWMVVGGLILGPVLLVLSVAINFTAPVDSLRAGFDSMAARPGLVVTEAYLETFGFMVVLAALAGAAGTIRGRGGALGSWGAGLSILGIVGFTLSNANGFTLAELAQLPDHDAGFATASALMSSGTASITGAVGMLLEAAGQLGILFIIGGLVRSRLVRPWILLPVLAGILINVAMGTMLGTLAADILLLAVGIWLAVAMLRRGRETWLGTRTVSQHKIVAA